MFLLSEKVQNTVSVKYQIPGEELDPDQLISVCDDGDLQVLKALRPHLRAILLGSNLDLQLHLDQRSCVGLSGSAQVEGSEGVGF